MKKKFPRQAFELQAAGEVLDEEHERPRFRMRANSGEIMPHWFFRQLAIDLDGLEIPGNAIPALLDHDTGQRVGWTEVISVGEEGLVAEGVIMEASDAGAQVLKESRAGYPWQASVYVPPLSIEEVQAGATAEVNGRTMHGPGTIFRTAQLREVSFVALGADQHTSANLLGTRGEEIDVMVAEASPENAAIAEGSNRIELTLEGSRYRPAEASAPTAEVLAERSRIASIHRLAVPGQQVVRDACVAEGIGVGEAATRLLEHLRTAPHLLYDKQAHLSAMRQSSPQPTGATPDVPSRPKDAAEAWERLAEEKRADYLHSFETFEHYFKKGKVN